jgi:DNA-binding NarL/FixJ family response regulator
MTDRIRLAIVDDHSIFRAGLQRIFDREEHIEVVAEGATADDAVRIARELAPDIIMLDINLPGDGIVAAHQIKASTRVKVILLTVSESEGHLYEALELGVSGYILKGIVAQELMPTLSDVHAGESYVSPAFAARMLRRQLEPSVEKRAASAAANKLTPLEEEVIQSVSQGLTNKQISRKLNLNERGVKTSLSSIMRKLSVSTRTAAAVAVSAAKSKDEPTD